MFLGDALNFHFPFYLAWDTPKSIASELVEHFDLSNEDLTLVAELIGSSIVKLVANLKPKLKQYVNEILVRILLV